MAKLTGFVFQDEYLERLKKLSDEELGRLVRALSGYHANGEIPELSAAESVAFDFIRADVDRIDHRYQAKCETNRNNRTAVHDRPRPLSSEDERDPPGTNVHKEKEKGKVKVNPVNLSLALEAGVDYKLTRSLTAYAGVYFGYCLTNIYKESLKSVTQPTNSNKLEYNSTLQSNQIDRASLLSAGVNVGIVWDYHAAYVRTKPKF